MNQSESIGELADALSKAQGEIGGAKKDSKNPHLNTKYADLESVWEACRSPLSKNGLAVVQLLEEGLDQVTVITKLIHKSNQWLESRVSAKTIGNKGLTEIQATGLIITYLRRYSLASMVGIYQEDNDGHQTSKTVVQPERKEQPKESIDTEINRLNSDFTNLMKQYNISIDEAKLNSGIESISALIKAKNSEAIKQGISKLKEYAEKQAALKNSNPANNVNINK